MTTEQTPRSEAGRIRLAARFAEILEYRWGLSAKLMAAVEEYEAEARAEQQAAEGLLRELLQEADDFWVIGRHEVSDLDLAAFDSWVDRKIAALSPSAAETAE